ncbi:hypothetical protein EK21DRAFT_84333 [Setomelanomma holmii]|uniref:Uncharacterized protein n=1 Tax=Setomelanomma holmii TaxID=210430 RepID=A0A9P4HLW5_9PLEO|nr:hypothetical protein EK21DRAFT_84333 [Setomelanomma holmii]
MLDSQLKLRGDSNSNVDTDDLPPPCLAAFQDSPIQPPIAPDVKRITSIPYSVTDAQLNPYRANRLWTAPLRTLAEVVHSFLFEYDFVSAEAVVPQYGTSWSMSIVSNGGGTFWRSRAIRTSFRQLKQDWRTFTYWPNMPTRTVSTPQLRFRVTQRQLDELRQTDASHEAGSYKWSAFDPEIGDVSLRITRCRRHRTVFVVLACSWIAGHKRELSGATPSKLKTVLYTSQLGQGQSWYDPAKHRGTPRRRYTLS